MTARSWRISPARTQARGWAAAVRTGVGRVSGTSCSRIDRWPSSPMPEQVDLLELESRLRAIESAAESLTRGRRLVIPVLYDGADLHVVAARLKLTQRRSRRDSQLGRLRRLRGRLSAWISLRGLSPPCPGRTCLGAIRPGFGVPAGSVAIAGRQTAIYPRQSPGGWHLLGTTPLCIADVEAGYFPIAGRRPHPVPADLRRRIRGQTSMSGSERHTAGPSPARST